jgi:hypothetical protein
MSSRYSQIRIAMDIFQEAPRFAPAGQKGDQFEQHISFEGDLPVPVPNFTSPPRVIITPVKKDRFDSTGGFNVMTPAYVARDLTPKGFRFVAFNTDPDFEGFSAFNWVAIEESRDVTNQAPELKKGVMLPHEFRPFRESFLGKRTFQDHGFDGVKGLPFDSSAASVQLTATDHNVQGHSVPAVGIVYNAVEGEAGAMEAHNIDIVSGACAFNWAKFFYREPFAPLGQPEPFIETGEVAEAWFEARGQPGDWRTWNVVFSAPFAKPPLIWLTAMTPADIPVRLNTAVVGVVQSAAASGFRLAARSCDTRPGLAGFYWIAVGDPA